MSVVPVSSEPGLLVQDMVYAGLDALRAVVPLDLCAYLHASSGFGPQLYLRAPDLSSMDATQAFDLFTTLRDALDDDRAGDRPFEVAGFDAVAMPTAGAASRGLYVVGRRETPLDETERAIATRLCAAIGAACHALEGGNRPPVEGSPLRVAVEVVEGIARAEVVVPVTGGLRQGRGEASSPTEAVAHATLDAADAAYKLGEVSEGEVAGERMVVVLVRDDNSNAAVGAALSGADHLHATALATLEAAERLRTR
jgi:hypothetical protein